jgi:DNA-binding Lrp family transcriptional regulator
MAHSSWLTARGSPQLKAIILPMLTAFVLINTLPNHISNVAQEIANIPNVVEVYSITGEHDLMAIIRLENHDQLDDAIPGQLAKIQGIQRTNTVIAFRRYSAKDLESAWDIGVA